MSVPGRGKSVDVVLGCVWGGGWLVEGVRSFGRTERDALRGRSSRR